MIFWKCDKTKTQKPLPVYHRHGPIRLTVLSARWLMENSWLFLLVGMLAYFSASLRPVRDKQIKLEGIERDMKSENDAMKDLNRAKQAEAEALASDPFYIEKVLRKQMNLQAPGESKVSR